MLYDVKLLQPSGNWISCVLNLESKIITVVIENPTACIGFWPKTVRAGYKGDYIGMLYRRHGTLQNCKRCCFVPFHLFGLVLEVWQASLDSWLGLTEGWIKLLSLTSHQLTVHLFLAYPLTFIIYQNIIDTKVANQSNSQLIRIA